MLALGRISSILWLIFQIGIRGSLHPGKSQAHGTHHTSLLDSHLSLRWMYPLWLVIRYNTHNAYSHPAQGAIFIM